MKKITNRTLLKQGDKTYKPIEVDNVIYWIDKESEIPQYKWFYASDIGGLHENRWKTYEDGNFLKGNFPFYHLVIAQSQPIIEGIPVISLDSYVDNLAGYLHGENYASFKLGYKSNQNQYTLADIEKAIDLSSKPNILREHLTKEEIIERINSISVIEVDEQFNSIDYE